MAKKSWLERNIKRVAIVKKFSTRRAELKAKGDYVTLAKLPKDASPIRLVNRCRSSGRRRGFIRKYGISRLTFRESAMAGIIPGVIKSSW